MQELHEEKILILAKTYPSLSEKYLETVCTAGVRDDGSWIRVYPIKFRQMDEVKRYHKYQWISCKVYKPELKNDPRPESFHIEGDVAIVGARIYQRSHQRLRNYHKQYALMSLTDIILQNTS